jgi:hypothetical protein
LKGGEFSRRDRQTTRLAFVDHPKRDDPTGVDEWEGMQ